MKLQCRLSWIAAQLLGRPYRLPLDNAAPHGLPASAVLGQPGHHHHCMDLWLSLQLSTRCESYTTE